MFLVVVKLLASLIKIILYHHPCASGAPHQLFLKLKVNTLFFASDLNVVVALVCDQERIVQYRRKKKGEVERAHTHIHSFGAFSVRHFWDAVGH